MFFSVISQVVNYTRLYSTKEIDAHVRECAIKLNDDSLLAKLAMSCRYACIRCSIPPKSLVVLYNRMRQHSSDNNCKSNHGKSTTVQEETLAELALYAIYVKSFVVYLISCFS